MQQNIPRVLDQSLNNLLSWFANYGFKGYDPYDIRGNEKYSNILNKSTISIIPLKKCIKFGNIFLPIFTRHVLAVEKEVNAKAMALFARAFLDLYIATGEKRHLSSSKFFLQWLQDNSSRKRYKGYCWGYPFHWQSLHFFPRGTPCGVVTAIAGDAFLTFYQTTKYSKYLDICISICDFFINDLNIDKISSDKICFSYTPIDRGHIHNANLFVADFLIRVGVLVKNKEYVEYGLCALRYTLGEQNTNGSFYYFGKKDISQYNLPSNIATSIDHYHTGFVLRCLYSIYITNQNKELVEVIRKCYQYYLSNLFEKNTIPKITPQSIYPIDIHSCAEAILCLSSLSKDYPEGMKILRNTTLWTIKEMQTRAGWFVYMIKKKMGIKWKIRIPFIRWGQAWMLRALSNYYLSLSMKDQNM